MTDAKREQVKPYRLLQLSLIVVGILSFLIVVAVLIVLYMPIKPHFPPESPDKMAKRQSQDNGFYKLREAAYMMTSILGLPLDDTAGVIWPEPDELPTDQEGQEEVLHTIQLVAPATAKMREGLAADYFLCPEIYDPISDYGAAKDMELLALYSRWSNMARMLSVQATLHEKEGRYREAMRAHLDAIRLGRVIGLDGSFVNFLTGAGIVQWRLVTLRKSLPEYRDPEILREALNVLQEITSQRTPLSQIIEFKFREVDKSFFGLNLLAITQFNVEIEGFLNQTIGRFPVINALWAKWRFIQFSRNAHRYCDQLLAAVDKPFYEFAKIRPAPPSDPWSVFFFSNYEQIADVAASQNARLNGTAIHIALQLYREENGSFPESLNTLVPGYFNTLPSDPFTGKSFHYERSGSDFRLYSLGPNRVDDRGVDDFHSGDLVIHLPEEESLALELEG